MKCMKAVYRNTAHLYLFRRKENCLDFAGPARNAT